MQPPATGLRSDSTWLRYDLLITEYRSIEVIQVQLSNWQWAIDLQEALVIEKVRRSQQQEQ